VVVGSDPPPRDLFAKAGRAIELVGFVEDIRAELARCAVFVCPVLSGSGVRVKLLEAFAAGIPVVSTTIGAEGLGRNDGEFCALADAPEVFAAKVLEILNGPREAQAMAQRARAEVEANWDMPLLTRKLERSYREVVREKRMATCRPNPA
jgi:glycosyltransferase involved in cell wall biosynthesis